MRPYERLLPTLFALWVPLVPGLLSGCNHSCSCPAGDPFADPFRPRTSVDNLLHNLRMAYQHRDLTELDSLLAPDFVFHFSEEDQGRPEIPDSWPRDRELAAHVGMFAEDFVQTLQLDFSYGSVVIDTVRTTAQDTVWTVQVGNFDLELFGTPRSHPGEPPQLYKVEDGRAQFWFRRAGHRDPSSGVAIWEIVACHETTATWQFLRKQPHPAESTTWGAIKALFE